jgi:hypothetical protein
MQKAKELDEEKVLIIISSLMVWNDTPKKLKEKGTKDPVVKGEGDEEGEEGEQEEEPKEPSEKAEEEDEENKSQKEEGEEGEKKKVVVEVSDEEVIEE